MTKIDIEKFICSIRRRFGENKYISTCLDSCLKDQGLRYIDKPEGGVLIRYMKEGKPIKVPKFKVGDFIQFNGMGHTRYTVKEVCGLSHYINTCNKRMDMSYTDANFELVEQKPAAWSEEDENTLNGIIEDLNSLKQNNPSDISKGVYQEEINWLKNLKNKVQSQPNQEWSEEDKKMIDAIYSCVDSHYDGLAKTSLLIWIKSLRPQSHWKPSKEQLDALRIAIGDEQGSDCCDTLRSLLKDLKSL